jgi:hypothetical protein
VRTALAALLLALALPSASWSQTVRGVITADMTNRPLGSVNVQLIAVDDANVIVTGNTTASGWFVLQAPAGGTYWFAARLIGYVPRYSRVELGDNEELSLELALTRLPTQLDTVYVRGRLTGGQREFESRRHLKWNFSYDWTQFKDLRAYTVTEVIRFGLPGGMFHCTPVVYLDGVKSRTFGIDVPLDWVYGIEIYRTYYDIPLEYRDPFASRKCGGVLIWTHRVGEKP